MKNILVRAGALLLCFVMLVGVCACARSDGSGDTESTEASSEKDTGRAPNETEKPEPEKESTPESRRADFIAGIDYPKYTILDSATPGFVGRWFERKINGTNHMVTLNDGSSFYFLTDGADSFDVNFTLVTANTVPYFSYSIDGAVPVRQLITSSRVELPDNGLHTVCIRADGMSEKIGKWESEIGVALKNVTVNGGELFGLMPRNKVIAFFGDSITEGVNALGRGANSDVNSATAAYPYFCTQALGAVEHNVGYGASGVCKTGSFNTFINAIDYLSSTRKVDDSFHPDVIVVNHGTNDTEWADADFMQELRKSLDRLIEKYPDVSIFYMIPFSRRKAMAIRSVCREYGEKITVVETVTWNVTLTDTLHPDAAGAENAGKRLAEKIKERLGEDFFAVAQ